MATTAGGRFWIVLVGLAVGCASGEPQTAGQAAPAAAAPAPGPTAATTPPGAAESAAPDGPAVGAAATVAGTIGGRPFAPVEAVYHWSPGADDLQLFLSEREGVCQVLTAGALPRDGVLVLATLKLNGPDRDGPFGAGAYPVRSGGERAALETKRATFVRLGPSCAPIATAAASGGAIQIAAPIASPRGELAGSVALEYGADSIRGRFVATYCELPDEELDGCQ